MSPWIAAAITAFSARGWADEPEHRHFYRGYDYGSQATMNPLSVFVNRGYDVLQLRGGQRNPFEIDYGSNAANVVENVADPFSSISERGWGEFVSREILPLRYGPGDAKWMSNYSLHLLGGGVTYVELEEWFAAHHVPAPAAASITVVMASAFMNELLENKDNRGANTDAIADLYLFDIGGIVLFSFDPVRRFFSTTVPVVDWSTPPALTYPDGDLHNHGNYFAAKWSLPFYPRLRLFSYFGAWMTVGFSQRLDGEHSLSTAAGVASGRPTARTETAVDDSIQWVPGWAIFLDRNDSLLAQLKIANLPDYFLHANVFPGVLPRARWLGLWSAVGKEGHFVLGLSTSLGFGAGFGTM
jgi:hypothetical protein